MVEVVVAADAGRTEGAESAGEQREWGRAGEKREGGWRWAPLDGGWGESPKAGGCGGQFECPPKMGAAVGALLELGFCPPAPKIR